MSNKSEWVEPSVRDLSPAEKETSELRPVIANLETQASILKPIAVYGEGLNLTPTELQTVRLYAEKAGLLAEQQALSTPETALPDEDILYQRILRYAEGSDLPQNIRDSLRYRVEQSQLHKAAFTKQLAQIRADALVVGKQFSEADALSALKAKIRSNGANFEGEGEELFNAEFWLDKLRFRIQIADIAAPHVIGLLDAVNVVPEGLTATDFAQSLKRLFDTNNPEFVRTTPTGDRFIMNNYPVQGTDLQARISLSNEKDGMGKPITTYHLRIGVKNERLT